MTHNDITLNEEKLIKENEILGKIVLETILRYSPKNRYWDNKTDEQITELLNQPNWREETKFEVANNKVTGKPIIYNRWTATWAVSAREPIKIIERLKEEKEVWEEAKVKNKELEITNYDYLKTIADKNVEINKLKKELEEKQILIESLETELEESDEIIDSHEAALETAKEWRLREEKNLKEKIEEQRDLVFTFTKSLVIKEREFDKLNESYGEEHEKLRKETKKNTVKDEKIKELEWKLYLANKSLPNLPKKSSKLKYLKNKITLKSQQLIEKVKHQSQELLARIEIKTK